MLSRQRSGCLPCLIPRLHVATELSVAGRSLSNTASNCVWWKFNVISHSRGWSEAVKEVHEGNGGRAGCPRKAQSYILTTLPKHFPNAIHGFGSNRGKLSFLAGCCSSEYQRVISIRQLCDIASEKSHQQTKAATTAVPKFSMGLADVLPPLHVNALVAQPVNALAGVPPLLMQLPLKVRPPLIQGSQAVRIVLRAGIKQALRIQPGTLRHHSSVSYSTVNP